MTDLRPFAPYLDGYVAEVAVPQDRFSFLLLRRRRADRKLEGGGFPDLLTGGDPSVEDTGCDLEVLGTGG